MSEDATKRYTEATKQYADLAQQGQQAVADAVEVWTKSVQKAFSNVPTVPKSAGEFDLADSVDRMYDFTEKVLELQRDFTKKLLRAATKASDVR